MWSAVVVVVVVVVAVAVVVQKAAVLWSLQGTYNTIVARKR